MDRRIRVLQVITRLVNRGASRHVVDLARSLDPERFEVEILAGRGEEYEGSLWPLAEQTGLRLHRVDDLQREIAPRKDLRAYRRIAAIIEDGDFDVVHTHISKSGLLGRLAATRADVGAVVHTYHGMVGEVMGPGVRARVLRTVERRCARMTDRCIAISPRVAQEFEAGGLVARGQCTVIPNGIDLSYYLPELVAERPSVLPEGGPVIGAVGSLTPEKGTGDLLRVAARMRTAASPGEGVAQLRVCIVGGGPLRGELEAEASRLGLRDLVIFSGIVGDVRPWLAAFDCLVMPSRSEGMPLTLVEAMAMGCPIVATQVGGVEDVVGKAAVLVPEQDEVALEAGIERVLVDAALRERLVAAGLARARGFRLEEMAARTGQVYAELLGVAE